MSPVLNDTVQHFAKSLRHDVPQADEPKGQDFII